MCEINSFLMFETLSIFLLGQIFQWIVFKSDSGILILNISGPIDRKFWRDHFVELLKSSMFPNLICFFFNNIKIHFIATHRKFKDGRFIVQGRKSLLYLHRSYVVDIVLSEMMKLDNAYITSSHDNVWLCGATSMLSRSLYASNWLFIFLFHKLKSQIGSIVQWHSLRYVSIL